MVDWELEYVYVYSDCMLYVYISEFKTKTGLILKSNVFIFLLYATLKVSIYIVFKGMNDSNN